MADAAAPFPTQPFEGRTALVTGGSRGIGRACAEMLAAGGAKVGVVYAGNTAAADETVAAIAAAGGQAEAMQCDVTNNEAAAELVKKVVDEWGQLDILVNNAGIIRDGLFATMSPENWGAVIDTNLTGVYNFCHAAIMPMMRARYGRIVNMSSVAAHYSNPGQANYAASKGGIEGLTRCLATEIAKRGITVNAVAPGFVQTDMTEAVRNAAGDVITKAIPRKRLGKPEDIARAVCFLADERNDYITGQTVTVDGGLTLGGM
ncbi:3-oxoacyl-[acyl-carrier-protein] reductase [Alienimonas sp. DA493]|uniref:3-oxoacyl-[acyl-carrier-protein] reductase n=1 Tax=Alienimonas sp. DA493 TaxID=3373605 RepID=UPI003754B3D1